ncbi:hypothetical protein GBAR_LOCUS19930 [Geodia barretti]|uniref:Uncharacterized protein n=1 Tax=Geodia barretti TaxID=519541 RepID=A0AA35WWL8_GEOBA|nr:hypothetical protein GBAR_LOCUS19930 [Geodia barretti]
MADSSNQLVVINDTTYSIVELPPSDTELVVAERKKLLGHIDLRSLVQDLGRVGRCIQVAFNGVIAAGPKYTDLQIKVQRLGYDVTRLCDKSAVTVSKFKRASTTILTDLQSTYEYLLSGFEDMALDTLSSVSDLAGQMAAAAEDLHRSFDDEAHKVEEVLEETQREEGARERYALEMKKKKTDFEQQQKDQHKLLKRAAEKEEQAEARYRECELQGDKALQDLGDDGGFFQKLGNGLTNKFIGTPIFGTSKETKQQKYEAINKNKREALEMRMQQEKERLEAYKKLGEFTVIVKNCEGEEEFAKSSAQALHKAMEGLKILAALMMQAALFWKQMQDHCKSLADDKLKDKVESAMSKYDETKRLKLWTSKPFKIQAVRFYAGWVALDNVCGEYMEAIKETQAELYKYIQENPTYEDAKKRVGDLALTFQKEIEDAKKACAERDSEMQKEFDSLTV